jgi:hypothetical protein
VLDLDLSLRPATRNHIDDLLLSIASILRLGRLLLPAEKRLRVLALSELALRRLLTLSDGQSLGPGDAATPKGAIEILNRIGPVFHLLAIADEPVQTIKNALKNIPQFGDSEVTFAAFEILRIAEQGQPLSAVFEKTLVNLPIADRMALLMDLAYLIGVKTTTTKGKRHTHIST